MKKINKIIMTILIISIAFNLYNLENMWHKEGLKKFNLYEESNKKENNEILYDKETDKNNTYCIVIDEYKNLWISNNIEVTENDEKIYLDESEESWKIISGNRVKVNKLDSGEYTAKVKDSTLNNDDIKIKFNVEKPFWRSKSSIFIYILVLIFLIVINKLKLRKLDKQVEERTRKLSEEMEKNKSLFKRVIELERNKTSYFINLSHELRTPLNVIYSTEQLICELNKSDKGIEKEKLDYYINVSKRNVERLLKIINDLIDISKMQHGNYIINLEDNDIVHLVEEATLSLKDYIEGEGINIIIDPEVEEKIIECDSSQIERCVINLVSNAAKYTDKGGTIEVILKDLGDNVRIDVKDNGCGIDKKFQNIIFDRFSQIVDKHSETKGGSGLGLTITKQIIEKHNGRLFVESELGVGSTFTIILPIKVNIN